MITRALSQPQHPAKMKTSPLRQSFVQRSGRSLVTVIIVIALCIVLAFVMVPIVFNSDPSAADSDPDLLLLHTVQRGTFESFVTESGDVESIDPVAIRCKVKSEGKAASTIYSVIEEGDVFGPREIKAQGNETVEQLVKQYRTTEEALRKANADLEASINARKTLQIPGELLLKFDDSAFVFSKKQQEILVASDKKLVIDAQSELEKAKLTLNEYKDGLFVVDQVAFESEVLQAQSQLKTAEEFLKHSQRVFKKGYVSRLQLEAQEVAVEMARKNVQVVEKKLDVHNKYTLARMVNEYQAEIRKQEAALEMATRTLELSQKRLDEIDGQIANCQEFAQGAGQVVYANDFERRDNIVIEEGAQIREGQVVLRLPDPKQMRVRVRVNDSKIKQIEEGDSAKVELDVNPDLPVAGEVIKINDFPYPRQWYGGAIEYGIEIKINDPPEGITPGQRAKVRILVERKENVFQVPIQSVLEQSGAHYCLVRAENSSWMTRQVAVGSSNGSFVVLDDGISEGEQVALNPDLLWAKVAPQENTTNAADEK